MTENVYLNRDRTKIVTADSGEAKWQISRKEATAMGLSESKPEATDTTTDAPVARKRKTTKKA